MLPTSPHVHPRSDRPQRTHRAGGLALIVLGAWLMAAQLTDSTMLGLLFLPMLGCGFLAWGIDSHRVDLLVPGGILLGIGIGTVLVSGPLQHSANTVQGGGFFLAFAAGWLLIAALSGLADTQMHRWPLIPAGIMAVFGMLLLLGGAAMTILIVVLTWWPLMLIAAGLALLVGGGWRR